jgi:O-antigen/teichoic acid export membrane protein
VGTRDPVEEKDSASADRRHDNGRSEQEKEAGPGARPAGDGCDSTPLPVTIVCGGGQTDPASVAGKKGTHEVARRGIRGSVNVIRRSSLARDGGWWLLLGMMAVNSANFGFHLVVSRLLAPSEYGALGALLGLLVVLAVPAGALQVVITREVAARRARASAEVVPLVLGPLLSQAVVGGVVIATTLVVIAPVVRGFLHLERLDQAVLLAAYVIPVAIGLVPKGVMLGESRFRLLAFAFVVGSIVKLGLGAALVNSGRGVEGAMAAAVLGEVVSAGILLPSLRRFLEPVPGSERVLVRWRDSGSAIFAFTGFWMLTGIDTLLARHFLTRQVSGFYVAASTAAQIAMFLPGAISIVVFPTFARANGTGPEARSALIEALAVVGAVGILVAAVIVVAPSFVIGTLFGKAYGASSGVAGLLALSAALLGLVGVLMHFHLAARSRTAASLSWLGVVFIIIAAFLRHSSMMAIVVGAFVAITIVLIAMLTVALSATRSEAAGRHTALGDAFARTAATKDLTIVVPFFNPGNLLATNVDRLLTVLQGSGATFEVIAVSDGSTDGSEQLLHGHDPALLTCVLLPKNTGKGEALRVGLARGSGRYLGFIDADGDLDPSLLDPFLALVKLYDPDVVLGSKRHPLSDVEYPPIRRVYSWGYQQLIRILFRLNIRDTQTGLKLVRRDVLADVLPRMVEKRFAFDLEMFVVARHLGYNRFFEAPVTVRQHFTSTVSLKAVRGMLLDTLAIFYRLRLLHYYDTPEPHDQGAGTLSPARNASAADRGYGPTAV